MLEDVVSEIQHVPAALGDLAEILHDGGHSGNRGGDGGNEFVHRRVPWPGRGKVSTCIRRECSGLIRMRGISSGGANGPCGREIATVRPREPALNDVFPDSDLHPALFDLSAHFDPALSPMVISGITQEEEVWLQIDQTTWALFRSFIDEQLSGEPVPTIDEVLARGNSRTRATWSGRRPSSDSPRLCRCRGGTSRAGPGGGSGALQETQPA